MNIRISTRVNQTVNEVREGFTESLFVRLNPPFPKVAVSRFDGCTTGDTVSLKLNFGLFKSTWTSKITAHDITDEEFFFVDEGTEMPGFLKSWKHRHLVEQKNGKTVITDDISYKTPFFLLDWLMYPLLYLQFIYRVPVYHKVFG